MNAILTLALKDLRLLSRDWFGLFWLLVFPLMMALFFGAIFSGMGRPGSNPLPVAVIDQDGTPQSKDFIARLEKSKAVQVRPVKDAAEAREQVLKGKLVAYLVLKSGFGARSGFGGPPREIELGIDPSRFAEAEFLKGMVMAESFSGMEDLFKDPQRASEEMRKNLEGLEKAKDLPPEFRKHLQQMLSGLEGVLKKVDPKALAGAPKQEMLKIETQPVARSAAGPRSSFEVTFAQSVLWALLGCVSAFSISVVTERMQGTLLRLRTSPLTWGQIIAGKGLACFLASVGVTVLLLAIAWLFLGVRLDQPLKLALAVVCTSVAFTGIMMFVSTLGKTEQSVAGAGWGIMMPLAMIGGCMVPLIAMPGWMQTASSASPVKWGIVALEGAIWRGFTYEEMLLPCTILLGVGVVFFALGVKLLSRQET